jgi:hypothetical protein
MFYSATPSAKKCSCGLPSEGRTAYRPSLWSRAVLPALTQPRRFVSLAVRVIPVYFLFTFCFILAGAVASVAADFHCNMACRQPLCSALVFYAQKRRFDGRCFDGRAVASCAGPCQLGLCHLSHVSVGLYVVTSIMLCYRCNDGSVSEYAPAQLLALLQHRVPGGSEGLQARLVQLSKSEALTHATAPLLREDTPENAWMDGVLADQFRATIMATQV